MGALRGALRGAFARTKFTHARYTVWKYSKFYTIKNLARALGMLNLPGSERPQRVNFPFLNEVPDAKLSLVVANQLPP